MILALPTSRSLIARVGNPSPMSWAIIGASAIAVSTAAYFLLRDDDDMQIPPDKVLNYVGAPGYLWPHRDVFPNERAFGLALQNLGYDTGVNEAAFSVHSPKIRAVVREFQRHYNIVRKTNWDFIPPGTEGVGSPDGLIGVKTIVALMNAAAWVQAANLPWPDLVDVARADQGIA